MTADDLKAWRASHGLNRGDAAKALGISRSSIERYEDAVSAVPRYVALACAAVSAGLKPIGDSDDTASDRLRRAADALNREIRAILEDK